MKRRVDQRFARVTVERSAEGYHSEAFNDAVAAASGLRSRTFCAHRIETAPLVNSSGPAYAENEGFFANRRCSFHASASAWNVHASELA